MEKPQGLGLYISFKTEQERGYNEMNTDLRFEFSLVRVDENQQVTNLGHSFCDDPYKWLDDIAAELRMHVSGFNDSMRPFDHYESLFFSGYKPELNACIRASKSLAKIHKGLDKLNTKRGYPVDGVEFIGRLCEVIGASYMVEATGKVTSWHTDNTHRFMTIGDGIDRLRRIIREDEIFQAAVTKAMAKVAA